CIVAILSLLCLRFGWRDGNRPIAIFNQTYSETKLLVAAAILSVAGAYFYMKVSRLPPEMTVGVQMSGAPVFYLFFARLLSYGLAISAICFASRPSLPAAAIFAADML